MSDPRSEIRAAFQRRIDRHPTAPDLPAQVVEHAVGMAHRRSLRLATVVAAGLALLVVATMVYVAAGRQAGRPGTPAGPPTASASPSASPSAPPTPSPVFSSHNLPDLNRDVGPMVQGPDAAVWFVEAGTPARIGRIDTTGTIRDFAVQGDDLTNVSALAAGPDGAVWFTQNGPSKIGRITSDGRITTYPVPVALSELKGIAAGPDGALWFTEVLTNKIGRITTAGRITEFPLPAAPGPGAGCGQRCPWGIVAGPDGALWFTESQFVAGGGDKIGRITVDGTVTEYQVPTAGSPADIILGPDDNLWFSDARSGKIGRVTPRGEITEFAVPGAARGLTSGPLTVGRDGAIWFVLTGRAPGIVSYQIGRITTAGDVSSYGTMERPENIAEGADGNLWMGVHGAIDRVDPYGRGPD